MKVGLFGVVFVTLLLRANCDNDNEMRTKLEAMEKRLAKMDAMEKHLAKIDAIEINQEDMQKHLVAIDQQQQGKVKGNGYSCNHY